MLAILQRKFRRVENRDSNADGAKRVIARVNMLKTMVADLEDENQNLRHQLAGEWDGLHVTVRHECDERLRLAIGLMNGTYAPAGNAEVMAYFQAAIDSEQVMNDLELYEEELAEA